MINHAQLLADEAQYCSFGDTVHYVNPPKIFTGCDGGYMYDDAGTPYLDLQMWYSAVNFGYKNQRLEAKMIEQLKELPQIASQYLHPTKIELAKFIAQDAGEEMGPQGPRALQRGRRPGHRGLAEGGAQRQQRQEPDVRLRGRLPRPHAGRVQHHQQLPLPPPLRHFGDRAQFIPFPYPFRRPKGMTAEEYSDQIVREFERKFENEYHAIWDFKTNQCEYAAFYVRAHPGHGRLRRAAGQFLPWPQKGAG